MPTMEDRIELLRTLREAPRPLLEALADASSVSLASIGLAAPVAPPPPVPLPAAPPVPQVAPLPPTAQMTVDDALREAAEELDMSPASLRPAMSRMLDRIARGGVPVDAAARMVLRVPKKESAKREKDGDA